MKKILLMLVAVMCLSSLFAKDAAAVKQTVIRDLELQRDGKFLEALNNYTKDAVVINLDTNRRVKYEDLHLSAVAIDGKHPEELIMFIFKAQNKRNPTPEEAEQLKQRAKTEQFLLAYPMLCNTLKSAVMKSGEINLKTLKFINVKVTANQATASYDYEDLNIGNLLSETIEKFTAAVKFRKENGSWKITELTYKKKK